MLLVAAACSPSSPAPNAAAPTSISPSTPSPASAPSAPTTASTATPDTARACTSVDVTATLDAAPDPGGQITIPLRYTNSTTRACTITGYPGATLVGPDSPPFGDEYQLPRSTATAPSTITLAPGTSAVANLTLGTTTPADPSGWQPTALRTIAPDDTTVMSVPFPADTPVIRQDGATHPASYIAAFTGPLP
jgi:hypothetical protein